MYIIMQINLLGMGNGNRTQKETWIWTEYVNEIETGRKNGNRT